jgi:hypothetical protein
VSKVRCGECGELHKMCVCKQETPKDSVVHVVEKKEYSQPILSSSCTMVGMDHLSNAIYRPPRRRSVDDDDDSIGTGLAIGAALWPTFFS